MSFSNSDLSERAECLFTPIILGAITLLHRIAHAPTIRLRASPDECPSLMMLNTMPSRHPINLGCP